MIWHTPPEDQGQIVEVSYGSSHNGLVWKRVIDQSEFPRKPVFYVADAMDCGCESECNCFEPWNCGFDETKFDWKEHSTGPTESEEQ